jgi:predicted O-methyltransferase YrrM
MSSFPKKLLWYLRKPVLYPELVRLAANKARCVLLGRDPSVESRRQAEAWCAKRSLTTADALEKIAGRRPSESLESKFHEIFRQGQEATEACPVKMGGAGDLDLLFHLAEFIQAREVIETGVAYGWSSLALLLSISRRNGLLVSTDLPYPGLENDPYVGCVVPEELRGYWKLLRGADRQRLPEAIRMIGSLDLCHYDSDKSFSGRMWAYPRLWKALRSGGIFISDDIGDNLGFVFFANSVAGEPIVVLSHEKYVGILVKP